MDTRPPYRNIQQSINKVVQGNTYMAIVLAANGLSIATSATSTNNGDRAAGDTEQDIEVLDDNINQPERFRTCFRSSLRGKFDQPQCNSKQAS